MTLEFAIQQPELEQYVNAMTPVVEETKIHAGDDCLWASAVDPANILMYANNMDDTAFDVFESDTDLTMGVNLNRLEDIVAFGDSDDTVYVELDEATHKLSISVGGVEYTLALIDPDSIREEPELPDLGLPNTIVTEKRALKDAVKAADMVSDHIRIAVENETDDSYVEMTAAGDTDDVLVRLAGSDELLDGTEITESASSLFSLDYLHYLVKAVPESDTEATLHLGSEHPLKAEFTYPGGNGNCTHVLAPRIENN